MRRGTQNASLSGVLNNHRPRSGFSDRLILSNPYTVACFPIKPVQQPLLLLPGTNLLFALVCVGIPVRSRAVRDCLPRDVFLWKDIEKHSMDHLHQSPTHREMERGMKDGRRDGRSPQKAVSGEKEQRRQKESGWMDEEDSSQLWLSGVL